MRNHQSSSLYSSDVELINHSHSVTNVFSDPNVFPGTDGWLLSQLGILIDYYVICTIVVWVGGSQHSLTLTMRGSVGPQLKCEQSRRLR